MDVVRIALAARRDAAMALVDLARRYGDVAELRAGPERLFLLSHPDLVEEILVSDAKSFPRGAGEVRFAARLLGKGLLASDGTFHLRRRAMIAPVVHGGALAVLAAPSVEHAIRARERWQEGEPFDLFAEMNRLTQTVMLQVLLDADVDNPEGRRVADTVEESVRALEAMTLPFLPKADRLPLPGNARFGRAKAALDQMVLGLIADRRARPRGDLLSALMAARDAVGNGMPDLDVRDEALSLFRGHKTTGTAVTWTFHLLSQHAEIEERFHAELDHVLAGRPPAFEDLDQLAYTRMVLAESMRVYPPAWTLSRVASANRTIGGHLIPKGSRVLASQFVLHHDPRYWPEPERFDPERFTPGAHEGRPDFAYFPFGAGNNRCMGDAAAPIEAVLMLAVIGQRWRLRPFPGHPVAYAPRATLKPKFGMRMIPESRGTP